MRSEAAFEQFVLDYFNSQLTGQGLLIAAGKNILTDVTCIYENGKFELIHGFSQTDIVIYTEQQFKYDKPPGIIRFYNDAEIRKGVLAVPYVIFELKTGALTTDSIRCRDFVADRIRAMFPFAAYYFIAEETKKEEKTLLRQGKSFTNYFISKDQIGEEYLQLIFEHYVKPHINNVKRQLKIMES